MKVVSAVPDPPATSEEAAAWLRSEVERMIKKGVAGVMISVEHHDRRVSYAAFPPLGGFVRGHILDLNDVVNNQDEDSVDE